MAERVIRIVLDANDLKKGLDNVKGKLKDTGKEAKKTGESMRALRSLAGGIIGALGVRELVRYADAWTNIGNRIRLVTDGTEEYNTVQDRLVGLAQRTRTDLTATAELYARVARSTQQLGASQNEVLRFTEATNQALQISGATAAEAGAGVIQFAQGLASGALRGDELRSVMEQMPRLASAISEEMGITIGELRKLGEEGKLTSEAIFKAVLDAAPKLQAEFDVITPTIGQALTTVKNFALTVVGSFNEAAGVTEGLVDIFKLTDEQTVSLAKKVRDMALAFKEFVEVATVAVASFVESVGPKFGAIQAEIIKIIAALTRDEDLFRAALEGQNEFNADLDKIKAKLDAEFEAIRRNTEARRAELDARNADLDKPRGEGSGGGEVIDPKAAAEAAKLLEKQAQLLASLLQQEEALAIASASGREYSEVLQDLKIQALAAANGNEAFAFDALGAAEEIRRLTAEIEAQEEALKADIERKAEAVAITQAARTETEKLTDEIARLQGFLDEGLISQETFDRSVKNLAELDEGVEDFFRRARENSQDILAGFLENGLQDIDDFARAFGDMLLKLASQALAAQIFKALFGDTGGGGSNAGIIASAIGAAAGGRQFGGGVQAGQAVGVAEGGRFGSEVFVPNVGGSIVPIGGDRGAAAAAAPPQVNLTNINTLDPSDITGAFNDGAGDTVLLNRITTKRQAFRRALGV